MGNADSSEKVRVDAIWKKFDKDGSGTLQKEELGKMLQMIWKRYEVDKPLSNEFIEGIFAELDNNKDGSILKSEFEELFDDLWEDRHQLVLTGKRSNSPRLQAHSSPRSMSPRSAGSKSPRSLIARSYGAHDSKKLQNVGSSSDNTVSCPFCVMELDSKTLDNCRVPPEQIYAMLTPGHYQHPLATAPFTRHPCLPAGTTVHGRLPRTITSTSQAQWLPLQSPYTVTHF